MQSEVKFCNKRHAVFGLWLYRVISREVRRTCLPYSRNVFLLIHGYTESLVNVAAAEVCLANQGARGIENRDERIAITTVICRAVIRGTRRWPRLSLGSGPGLRLR